MRKSFAKIAVLSLAGLSLAACGKYNYAPEATKQDRQAEPRIYGEVDGPPLQTKKTYPTNPEAAAKAAELRAKMFGDANAKTTDGATAATPAAAAPAKADSTKK